LRSAPAILLALATLALLAPGAQASKASARAHVARAGHVTHGARSSRHTHRHAAPRHRKAHGKYKRRHPHHPSTGRQSSPAGPSAGGAGKAAPAGAGSGETPWESPSGHSGSNSAPSPHLNCELLADPNGSDASGDGSLARPYQSVVKLDRALAPGQTGCLRGGTYGSIDTWHQLSNDGTPSGQITITAYPGETAKIVGWVDIEASYTTLAGLEIDGSNTFYRKTASSYCPTPHAVSQALDIAGTGDVFERNDYYQSIPALRGNGIGVGFWGNADDTTIRFNRIHDVGQCQQFDHLIYLASGDGVQIYDNWLYNDHNGFGVTVYPRPTNARIFANVIDAAGSGVNFGDMGVTTTRGNKAWHNVVTSSVRVLGSGGHLLAAALVMCPELSGSSIGNEVFANDSFGNPDGISAVGKRVSDSRLSLSDNLSVDPRYRDAANDDFDVDASSPVASWGLWNGS
jgi:hypothetical protein